MLPLAYDEVVDRYNIDMLKAPGDFVLRNGDLALTRGGDLMLNNEEYSALFRLVQRWRFNAPTLKMLFDTVFASGQRRRELDDEMNQVFKPAEGSGAFHPLFSKGSEERISRFHEINEEMGASEFAMSAYASAIVLVLADLLLALRDDLSATRDDWEKGAPLIGGCSVGAILEASANNFRHKEEWIKTRPPSPRQLASIRILAAAFGEPIAPDGMGHRMGRDICPETLTLLSQGNFDRIPTALFAFGNNMALRRHRINSGASSTRCCL